MTAGELREWCLTLLGAEETFPFGERISVFKTRGKMFALSALGREPLAVSVKCEPDLGERLRASYEAIAPGYHLNKRHWITIYLGGDAPDDLVERLLEDSYALVAPIRGRTGGRTSAPLSAR
jgi:predicted DNA-binding protein (MmcQ/YjbR family)